MPFKVHAGVVLDSDWAEKVVGYSFSGCFSLTGHVVAFVLASVVLARGQS